MDTIDTPKIVCEICNTAFTHKNTQIRTCSKKCSYELRNKTRHHVKHEPVQKKCIECLETFQDYSKKKLVIKCQNCVYANMASKRKQNGSYHQTDERKLQQSLLMKRLHQERDFISDEGIRQLSEKAKSRWQSDDYRSSVKKRSLEKYGVEHWTKTEEARKQLSERSKKYRASDETKQKMRVSAAKRLREGRNLHPFHGKGGYRQDIDLYVRSRWEANFARYLLLTNQKFEYEKVSFSLRDGRTYTPDFKVENMLYEIKGWWTQAAKEKFEIFKEDYPEAVVQIIDEARYNQIQDQYAALIPNWEYK
jgi:hypothetical protein